MPRCRANTNMIMPISFFHARHLPSQPPPRPLTRVHREMRKTRQASIIRNLITTAKQKRRPLLNLAADALIPEIRVPTVYLTRSCYLAKTATLKNQSAPPDFPGSATRPSLSIRQQPRCPTLRRRTLAWISLVRLRREPRVAEPFTYGFSLVACTFFTID